MSITLYKPGNTHIVRGISCTLQTAKNSRVMKGMLNAGFFKSPEECYPNKYPKEEKSTNSSVVTIDLRELNKDAKKESGDKPKTKEKTREETKETEGVKKVSSNK